VFKQYRERQDELSREGKRIKGPLILPKKTGSNEKCPCGSGLKFKKCCIDGPREKPKTADFTPEESGVIKGLYGG